MSLYRYPLRFTLPVTIFLVGSVIGGLLILLSYIREKREFINEAGEISRTLASIAASQVEYHLRHGEEAMVRMTLDNLKTDRAFLAALLFDDQQRVLLVTVGSNESSQKDVLDALSESDFVDVASAVRPIVKVLLSPFSSLVVTPLSLPPPPGELSSSRIGGLVLHRNLGPEWQRRLQAFRNLVATVVVSVLGIATILWLLLHRFLFQRMNLLLSSLSVAEPGFETPARLGGKDELSIIAAGIKRFGESLREKSRLLSISEQGFRMLFEDTPNPMWVYDPETLAFLTVNRAAVRHYGYTQEEFLSMTIKDIRPPEDVSALEQEVSDLPNSGFNDPKIWRHCKKDGTLILVEITSTWTEFPGKRARIVLATDVTERKAAEEALRRFNEQLEQSVTERTRELESANQALESFAYSVSHDLKAPLRGIDGYSRLLEQDYGAQLDEEGRLFLTNIRTGAEQMDELIEDLLAYSRIERRSLHLASVDLNALVQSVLNERKALEGASGASNIRTELPALKLRVDREGLLVALRNLLENAVKFSRDASPPEIEIGAQEKAGAIVFWVRDNGIGFDMKFHDKIFEIFQRLHRNEDYPGTGIGLAIVRKAIGRLGGRVWAESSPGHGSTFYVEVPSEQRNA